MGLFSFFNKELAIDLGTANTVIIYNDKVVVDEPSIIAIQRDDQKVMAVGKRAMMMHGKTHENIKTIRPLRDGVIADFQAAEYMLRDMIKMINFHNSNNTIVSTSSWVITQNKLFIIGVIIKQWRSSLTISSNCTSSNNCFISCIRSKLTIILSTCLLWICANSSFYITSF